MGRSVAFQHPTHPTPNTHTHINFSFILAEGSRGPARAPGRSTALKFACVCLQLSMFRNSFLITPRIRTKLVFIDRLAPAIPANAKEILICSEKTEHWLSKPTKKFFGISVYLCLSWRNPGSQEAKCCRSTVRLPTVLVYLQMLAVVCPASSDKDLNKANPSTTEHRAPHTVTVSVTGSMLSCSDSTSWASATEKALLKAGFVSPQALALCLLLQTSKKVKIIQRQRRLRIQFKLLPNSTGAFMHGWATDHGARIGWLQQ